MKKPKILLLDIETAPLTGYFWRLFEEQGGTSMLDGDWFLLSWSAKWYDQDKVMYMDQRNAKDLENEKKILIPLRALMEQADIIIGHNGDRFDIKRINTRIQFHNLEPLIKGIDYRTIDTLKIAKKHFDFTSNKLEYLAKFLGCKQRKTKSKVFPGVELWKECLKRNKEAFKEMQAYNMQDVLTLQDVYDKLKAWDTSINFSVFNDGEHVCSCGETKLIKKGLTATNSGVFQRYKCSKCGKPYKSKVNQLSKEQKQKMREVK
jgi:DNA polymerase elongation subunit (family B)